MLWVVVKTRKALYLQKKSYLIHYMCFVCKILICKLKVESGMKRKDSSKVQVPQICTGEQYLSKCTQLHSTTGSEAKVEWSCRTQLSLITTLIAALHQQLEHSHNSCWLVPPVLTSPNWDRWRNRRAGMQTIKIYYLLLLQNCLKISIIPKAVTPSAPLFF